MPLTINHSLSWVMLAFVNFSSTGTHVALPELHSNSATAISFTTYYETPFGSLCVKNVGPPGWRSGLGNCIAVLAVPPETQALSQPAATGRAMRRRTIGLASSGLGRAWPVGISLPHRALETPVAGWAQCALTRSPGAQCFLRHIGAAGFRVGCALC
jgi:hypothetical protein